MPSAYVQSRDAGSPPAAGHVFEIDPGSIGVVEEEPAAVLAKRQDQTKVRESMHQIGKALVASGSRAGGGPEDCSLGGAKSGQQRRSGGLLSHEDSRSRGQLIDRQLSWLLPYHADIGIAKIHDLRDSDLLLGSREAEFPRFRRVAGQEAKARRRGRDKQAKGGEDGFPFGGLGNLNREPGSAGNSLEARRRRGG